MAKLIQLPDGSTAEFPDTMSDDEIATVLREQFPPPEAKPEELSLREKIGSLVNEIPGVEGASRAAAEFLGIEPGAAPSETAEVLMNLPLPKVGALQPFGSTEEILEALPAAGGSVGAIAGAPGAIAGSGAGELLRQGVREALGAAPATGVIQEATGMDPESLKARAANVGIEMATGGAGEALAGLTRPLARMARRSIQNLVDLPDALLKEPTKRGDLFQTRGKEILDRFAEEGIATPGSTRTTQVKKAAQKLEEATATAEGLEAALVDEFLSEDKLDELVKTLEDAVPELRPGGEAEAGSTVADTTRKVLDDANKFITELRSTEGGVTLGRARAEKQRITGEIENLFEGGANTPLSKKAMKRAGGAWQKAINETFPELGDAELRRSDLITINENIRKSLVGAEFAGTGTTEEGVGLGAALAGRGSVPAMIAGRATALATAGPVSSLSHAGKKLLARILSSPGTRQAWLRLMSQLREESE